METVIVYLNEARSGNVVCKQCGAQKQINFHEKKIPRSGIAKCKCGNTFSMSFEKRKYYRKQINVTGKCFTTENPTGFAVKLVDISLGGIGLLKSTGNPLQYDETIRLVFQLGDGIVNCTASVCSVRDQRVGVKFTSMDEHSKKILGFFLMP